MSPRKRSSQDLRRRKPYKEEQPTVLIICEGGKTEPSYFINLLRTLRISSATVEVCGKCGSTPKSIVDFAVSKNEKRNQNSHLDPIERTWCVFDTEGYQNQHPHLLEAYEDALAKGFYVALSNPCFEYWFLLHYENTARPAHNCAEVIRQLKAYYPTYLKGDDEIFDEIYINTETAINRAKGFIRNRFNAEEPIDKNPSTYVYLLVEFLKGISQANIVS